jgi:hypothetical protein
MVIRHPTTSPYLSEAKMEKVDRLYTAIGQEKRLWEDVVNQITEAMPSQWNLWRAYMPWSVSAGEMRGLSFMEALWSFTTNAASIALEGEKMATIESGRLADLVAVGGTPLRVDPRTLKDIPVGMTMVGGEITYDRRWP